MCLFNLTAAVAISTCPITAPADQASPRQAHCLVIEVAWLGIEIVKRYARAAGHNNNRANGANGARGSNKPPMTVL
jgi:hypothetical protein